MNTTHIRHILITGATDGIGLALARCYQVRNAHLVLVGRRALADLDPAFFNQTNYCQADLAQIEAAEQIHQFLQQHEIQTLDLLIQNAAIGYVGKVADQPAASTRQLLAVNLATPIALTQKLLPYLQQRRSKVVFISSVATALPTADYAVYTASKAALEGFARNLRIELGENPAVQVIYPGATRTAMHSKAGADPAQMNWQRFPPPAQTAAMMLEAIETNQTHATLGLHNQIGRFAGRWLAAVVDWLLQQRRRQRSIRH